MGAAIATLAVMVLAVGVGYWGANALMPRLGLKTMRDQPRAKRRLFWLSMAVGVAIATCEGWAFSTDHDAVGVAVLIAFLVLPEFVLIALRIRRSQHAAKQARAQRTGSSRSNT